MTQIMNLAQMHLGPEEPIVPLAYYEHPDYLSFMKNVENAGRTGRNPNGVWFPHSSFEGGTPTMGYGHKMTNADDFSRGLTDQQVDALLVSDLQAADARLRSSLGNDYNTLNDHQLQMLLDIAFNTGSIEGFPKFRKAVVDRDIRGITREHHRHSGGQPLERRNRLFAQEFGLNFDPTGTGYDYGTAKLYGMNPDSSGHYFSRVPQTGLLLKGANHPTFPKTREAEEKLGNTIFMDKGRYYSLPSPR